LDHLENITLWCDRWYPTLVPDYRSDDLRTDFSARDAVPGRGGKENEKLTKGRYGEHWSCQPYWPKKKDERAERELRTGLKMRVDMRLDLDGEDMIDEVEKEAKPYIWSLMNNAGIEVEGKPGKKKGWRK
jgi:hypothetical protein